MRTSLDAMEGFIDERRERRHHAIEFLALRLSGGEQALERRAALVQGAIELGLRASEIGSRRRKLLLLMRDRLVERPSAADRRARIGAEILHLFGNVGNRLLEL